MRALRNVVGTVLLVITLGGGVLPAASGSPGVLRALQFNIHAGIGVDGVFDLGRTAAAITDSGADVVALQEVDVHWSARSGYTDGAGELARRTGMFVFFAPIYDLDPEPGHAERRRFGVAILSKQPILRAWNHWITRRSTVDPSAAPAPAPGFPEIEILVHGRPVQVYATHLDFRPEPAVRATQVAETSRILDAGGPDARQLLLGDFNAGPDAAELAPLFARNVDAWAATHGPAGGYTYPTEGPTQRIDYLTAAGALPVRHAEPQTSTASDHLPVLGEFGVS